jgi:hypothetical protein
MKSKIGLVFLMILMIAGVGLSFFYFFKFKQTNLALEESKKVLELKQDTLELKQDTLQRTIDTLNVVIAEKNEMAAQLTELINQNENQEAQLALAALERQNNAKFEVGINGYGTNRVYSDVDFYVKDKGFGIAWSKKVSGRSPSGKNRIYYYSSNTIEIAMRLEKELAELTGKEFEAIRGSSSDKYNRIAINLAN